MEPVSGQDDRERERHAKDGVWLPAGEGQHGAFPAVGKNPGPGLPRGRPFPPWPAAVHRRWAERQRLQGGTGSSQIHI